MNIKILFEDKNILVIDKPAGITVHPDGRNDIACYQTRKIDHKIKTISDWILLNYPSLKNVGEPIKLKINDKELIIKRPGIVHRLDKETSGVLIIAKNQKTFLFLKEQFQNHKIKKVYRAFVYGFVSDPKASLATNKRGVINVPIGRSQKDIRSYTAGRGAREPLRESITEYIILNRFIDNKNCKDNDKLKHQYSYIEAYPKTGRTHQIRVHMRYINHPVVSDPLYRGERELALGMNRLALHSLSVTFMLPDGNMKTVESPLPPDFKKVIKTYLA